MANFNCFRTRRNTAGGGSQAGQPAHQPHHQVGQNLHQQQAASAAFHVPNAGGKLKINLLVGKKKTGNACIKLG